MEQIKEKLLAEINQDTQANNQQQQQQHQQQQQQLLNNQNQKHEEQVQNNNEQQDSNKKKKKKKKKNKNKNAANAQQSDNNSNSKNNSQQTDQNSSTQESSQYSDSEQDIMAKILKLVQDEKNVIFREKPNFDQFNGYQNMIKTKVEQINFLIKQVQEQRYSEIYQLQNLQAEEEEQKQQQQQQNQQQVQQKKPDFERNSKMDAKIKKALGDLDEKIKYFEVKKDYVISLEQNEFANQDVVKLVKENLSDDIARSKEFYTKIENSNF